jgi:RimJ/RimL family protein N-acetyltransferase
MERSLGAVPPSPSGEAPTTIAPMPQTWVTPVTLTGTRVRMEPLAERHLDDLARVAFDDLIWRWTIAKPIDDETLRAWFDQARANAETTDEVPFATVDLASDRAVGSSRFMSIAPEHRRLEIGWTWLGLGYQRSGANREAKLLQLTHAFETLDAQRVEFKTHARNTASRTALLGIGATFEGVLRHHTIMPDGSNRDSAFYGVIAPEWPSVKARLQGLLDR